MYIDDEPYHTTVLLLMLRRLNFVRNPASTHILGEGNERESEIQMHHSRKILYPIALVFWNLNYGPNKSTRVAAPQSVFSSHKKLDVSQHSNGMRCIARNGWLFLFTTTPFDETSFIRPIYTRCVHSTLVRRDP